MCKKINILQKDNKEENKILRTISSNVDIHDISSKKIQEIISRMKYFLEVQPDGAALAAPQIGSNKRIFIVSHYVFEAVKRKLETVDDLIFINPKIIKKSKKTIILEEGCFSVRWWYGEVKRSSNIKIEAYNGKGVKKIWSVGGLLSQVFQHEIDHLDGVLFSDKAKNLEKMNPIQIMEIDSKRKELEKKRK